MLKKDNAIIRYIGGGKVFFTPKGGTEREIGECQSANVSIETELAEAINRDNCMAVKAGKMVKAINGKVEFTTQNINLDNMAMSMLGKVEDVAFKTGDTLPDGTTATADISIKCIKAGQMPILEGALKFVGDSCGDEKPVLVIHNAIISPNGTFEYITEEYQKLGFSGEVLKADKGYFEEYRMAVA